MCSYFTELNEHTELYEHTISPYSVRMRENTHQNNSEYQQFLRSAKFGIYPKEDHCTKNEIFH